MLQNQAKQSRAFTLVELLVVIAIIGILMAMVLPAVQSAREAGRRTTCANNIRNLGSAALQHLNAQRCYPSGGWGWTWAPDPDRGFGMRQPGSWLYSLLPYLEETTLHDLGKGLSDAEKRTVGLQRAMTPIPMFHCPTRRRAELYKFTGNSTPKNIDKPVEVARSDYAANGGDNEGAKGMDQVEGFGTNALSMSLTALAAELNSKYPKNARSKGVVLLAGQLSDSAIKDGTAKTYLLGERHLHFNNYDGSGYSNYKDDNEGWYAGYNNDSIRWTSLPPESDLLETPEAYAARWGAAHLTIFNIAMCDGSVRGIPFDIDPGLHQVLGNRADGQMIGSKSYDLSGLAQ